jgi:hypothetical protein
MLARSLRGCWRRHSRTGTAQYACWLNGHIQASGISTRCCTEAGRHHPPYQRATGAGDWRGPDRDRAKLASDTIWRWELCVISRHIVEQAAVRHATCTESLTISELESMLREPYQLLMPNVRWVRGQSPQGISEQRSTSRAFSRVQSKGTVSSHEIVLVLLQAQPREWPSLASGCCWGKP